MIVVKEALRIFEELNALPDIIIGHRQMASLHTSDISTCSHHLSQALSLELHLRVVLETFDGIVDMAKKLTKEKKFLKVAKLGGKLFEHVVEKKEWKNKELETTGMLAKKVCELIVLITKSSIIKNRKKKEIERKK